MLVSLVLVVCCWKKKSRKLLLAAHNDGFSVTIIFWRQYLVVTHATIFAKTKQTQAATTMSQLFMKVVPPSNNKKRKLSEIEQVEPPRKRAKTDKFNTNEHFQKWSKDISRFAKKSHAAASFVDIIVPDFLEEKMFEKLFEGKGHKVPKNYCLLYIFLDSTNT